jgi:hypothetical protein
MKTTRTPDVPDPTPEMWIVESDCTNYYKNEVPECEELNNI